MWESSKMGQSPSLRDQDETLSSQLSVPLGKLNRKRNILQQTVFPLITPSIEKVSDHNQILS